MSEAVGWYAYGVVPARADPAVGTLVGVDPQFAVGVVTSGDVAAVASRVRLREFGPEALEQNLEDRAWLERTARVHDAVVTSALDSGAVVPLRLCTIFSSRERLQSMLGQEEVRLREELQRLEGRAEWAVKILADPELVEGAAGGGEAEPTSGRAYLASKREQRSAREDAQAMIDATVADVHEQLGRHACATAVLRPQNAELSGRRGHMVYNGAYLVDRARADDFASIVARLAEARQPLGVQLELSGPWAPYNFVTTGVVEP